MVDYKVLFLIVHLLLQTAVLIRVLEKPHRQPESRIAWIVVILVVPVIGIFAYLMFGETNIGRRNWQAMEASKRQVSHAEQYELVDNTRGLPADYAHLFSVGYSISGFPPVQGNRAELMSTSRVAIDRMVEDIRLAEDHVDVLFYIWLVDSSGEAVARALIEAAGRGVFCRAMVDRVGSRRLLKSSLWRDMKRAGVHTAVALPLGSFLLWPLQGRMDLRNHRKIVVIDGRITYCGSQNCADEAFFIKAKYGPWVDTMLRVEGPVAAHNEALFGEDWTVYAGAEPISDRPASPVSNDDTVVVQVIATGPNLRYSAMPEMFLSLMFRARRELVITTPYYVPTQAMQEALRAVAYRGVSTMLVVPARNDSREVAAASRSYYSGLLQAGVKIFEFEGGLLHSKTLTLDGDITLIGSANLDRRSFDLNFENNMLIYSPALTLSVRERQQSYMDRSKQVSLEEVAHWSLTRRIWNNAVAMMGPIL
ncbi:MAG: cardiolipin synthase [Halioglobus sp.]|nr:cardiolipin synthase [Halioglobus sp.]